MAAPFVSIIIPFYKRQAELEKLLPLLAGQDRQGLRLEVIVVQDGCEIAGADELLNKYSELGLRFVANSKNSGPGYSRNHGARTAQGEYFWFIDTDALPSHPGVLQAVVAAQLEDPSRLAIGGMIESDAAGVDFVQRPAILPAFHFMMEKVPLSEDYRESVPFFSTTSFFVRRDRFERIGGFDTQLKMYEDNELSLALVREFGAGEFHQNAKTMMLHRLSPAGRDTGFFDYFKSQQRYMRIKFFTRNLMLRRYHRWKLLFLVILEPISIVQLVLGGRRGKYQLSRLQMSKSSYWWAAWMQNIWILLRAVVSGAGLFFLPAYPALRRADINGESPAERGKMVVGFPSVSEAGG